MEIYSAALKTSLRLLQSKPELLSHAELSVNIRQLLKKQSETVKTAMQIWNGDLWPLK